jgi:hypothetical protein
MTLDDIGNCRDALQHIRGAAALALYDLGSCVVEDMTRMESETTTHEVYGYDHLVTSVPAENYDVQC